MIPARLGRDGIPALLSLPEPPARSALIVLPGGGVAYDKRWAAEWLPLKELPVAKAYVDLPLHGERLAEDLRQRFRHDRIKRFFAPAVLGMAKELPSIIDDLAARLASPRDLAVGVCGWSIGGLAAFLAALEEPRIRAVAGFGIPGGGPHHLRLEEWPADPEGTALLEELDLLARAERLYPRAVLLLHGADDAWVHAESSRSLHDALKLRYAGAPEKLRYVEIPGVPHDPRGGPADATKAIVGEIRRWFERHLTLKPSHRAGIAADSMIQ